MDLPRLVEAQYELKFDGEVDATESSNRPTIKLQEMFKRYGYSSVTKSDGLYGDREVTIDIPSVPGGRIVARDVVAKHTQYGMETAHLLDRSEVSFFYLERREGDGIPNPVFNRMEVHSALEEMGFSSTSCDFVKLTDKPVDEIKVGP